MRDEMLLAIDMGTTRTRLWLMQQEEILKHYEADFGARDGAEHGTEYLRDRLKQMLHTLDHRPSLAIAAGMITSASGIAEVPHIEAPADLPSLAAGIRTVDIDGTPVRLVPGVRFRLAEYGDDVIRGEETLVIGLMENNWLRGPHWVVTLGSHWKWIAVDGDRRIIASRSSLAGEILHAVSDHTLLRHSLPRGMVDLDIDEVRRGMKEAESFGIGRAFFSVRLLDLSGETTTSQRASFFYGSLVQSELKAGLRLHSMRPASVVLTGHAQWTEVWQQLLMENGICSRVLTQSERDAHYLAGLRALNAII